MSFGGQTSHSRVDLSQGEGQCSTQPRSSEPTLRETAETERAGALPAPPGLSQSGQPIETVNASMNTDLHEA